MLIATSTLTKEMLKDEVAIVTGGGRGIGQEAVRSLVWLGARVIVAEGGSYSPEYSHHSRDFLKFS